MWKKNFVSDVIDRIYDVITFISKDLYFKKAWGSYFCWHHQNFDPVYYIYKDSRKVKINRNYVSKCNVYLYFLINQNFPISGQKMLMPAELKGFVTWFIYFLDLLWLSYNSANFHHCRICVTDFIERGAFLPTTAPPSVSSPEKAHSV